MNEPQVPLSSRLAGWLAGAGAFATTVAGLLLVTDADALGIDPDWINTAAAWLALASGLATGAVVILRRNGLPGITSGVGTETPATATTTTETTVEATD